MSRNIDKAHKNAQSEDTSTKRSLSARETDSNSTACCAQEYNKQAGSPSKSIF